MKVVSFSPRIDWKEKCEAVGFNFHTLDDEVYWDETKAYEFTNKEIDYIEDATAELHEMAINATKDIIISGDYAKYGIPEYFVSVVENSWKKEQPSLYGRMDLCWDGKGHIKLLEYNADTPTSLLEASIVQCDWLYDINIDGTKDQYNSIHEKLINTWENIITPKNIHFSAQKDIIEDINTVEYLMRTLNEANLIAKYINIDDIGYSKNKFLDLDNNHIELLFKLYPTEWLLDEEFGKYLNDVQLIEPAWKVITSSKAILVKLWEMYTGHPYLLPTYFTPNELTNYVSKPIFSREGANIEIVSDTYNTKTPGLYGGKCVYQQYNPLPKFNDYYALIGSWIIGDIPAGIGIRESSELVTTNTSRFVPHYFI